MNRRSSPFNTKYLENSNSIRKRESSKVELNTELHQQPWCCFSLHKIQVELADISGLRRAFSGMNHFENATPHSFSLI